MKDDNPHNKDLHAILSPYIFALKEGKGLLDYSLLMLKVSAPEVIPSPGSKHVMKFLPTAHLISEQLSAEKSPFSSESNF